MSITRARVFGYAAVIAAVAGGAGYGLTRTKSSLCRASEPASWRTAARSQPAHTWRLPSDSGNFAAFPDGTLVVDERTGAGGEALVRVSPAGARKTLFALPAGEGLDSLEARGDRAVATYYTRRDRRDRLTATVAVQVRTGAATTIAGAASSVTGVQAGFTRTALGTFDVDRVGRVWFTTGAGPRPTLYRYDLATGHRAAIAQAPPNHRRTPSVEVALDGVYWSYPGRFDTDPGVSVLARAFPLPAPVAAGYGHPHEDSLVTDGRAYAWANGWTVSWWEPGMRKPRSVDVRDADDHTFGVDTVAGPLVSSFSGEEGLGSTVIDMRTGAYVVNPKFAWGGNSAETPRARYAQVYRAGASATVYKVSTPLPRLRC